MVRHICLWILLIHLLSDEVDDQKRIRNMKLMVARISRQGQRGEHPHRPRVRSSGALDAPCRPLEGPRGAMGAPEKADLSVRVRAPIEKRTL